MIHTVSVDMFILCLLFKETTTLYLSVKVMVKCNICMYK